MISPNLATITEALQSEGLTLLDLWSILQTVAERVDYVNTWEPRHRQSLGLFIELLDMSLQNKSLRTVIDEEGKGRTLRFLQALSYATTSLACIPHAGVLIQQDLLLVERVFTQWKESRSTLSSLHGAVVLAS